MPSRSKYVCALAVVLGTTLGGAACSASSPVGPVAGPPELGGNGVDDSGTSALVEGGSAPTSGPCAGTDPGIFCGARLGLDPSRRYTCDGGPRAFPFDACDEGCDGAQAGTNDQCYRASCSGRGNGLYCGNDTINGNPILLYRCVAGVVASKVACPGACLSKGAGFDDSCATSVPGAPTNVRAAPGNGFAEVRWSASVPPSTGFSVTVSPGGRARHAAPGDRSAHVGALSNGTTYTFTVTADSGPDSLASNAVTPNTSANVIADVGFHPQLRPLTCEEASLQMALEHAGIFKTEATILNDVGIDLRPSSVDTSNILHWGNPYTSFVGDPSGSEVTRTGYGTYYPNIARVAAIYGATVMPSGENIAPATLYAALLANHPAVVWIGYDWNYHAASMTWLTFDGRTVEWRGPVEHAVTLVGVTEDSVLVNNPAHGTDWQWVTRGTFETAYSTYRNMAVILD